MANTVRTLELSRSVRYVLASRVKQSSNSIDRKMNVVVETVVHSFADTQCVIFP